MDLGQCKTKPSIENTLSFSHGEVRDALIDYAKRKGYGFLAEADVVLHFWDRAHESESHFDLSTNCSGTNPGIIKTKETHRE